jgi:hypothetical protein
MRPVALQRKTCCSLAMNSAPRTGLQSPHLVETCKLLAINPNAYLADVLARIVTRLDGDPIDDLLPGSWVDTKAAEPTFETSNIAQAA